MSVSRANALTAAWASASPGAVFSGAAVYPLLTLLASVAGGLAREELLAVAPSPLTLPVRAALGLWTREGCPLSLDWAARSDPRLTGDPAVDGPLLGAWAAAHTGGLVPAIPAVTVEQTGLLLASAVSVVADWQEPFTDGVMRPAAGPWAGRRLASLHRRGPELPALRILATPAGPVTLLTVAGTGGLDVVLCTADGGAPPGVVLCAAVSGCSGAATPHAPGPPGAAEAITGPGVLAAEVDADDPEPELVVKVPRFAVTASHDLLAAADVFGLRAATAAGSFPGISPAGVRLTAARQSAAASFTAPGFRPAAVTAAAIMPVAYRPASTRRLRVTVRFDSPFGYAAVHRPTGLVLAAGWVTDPEEAQP